MSSKPTIVGAVLGTALHAPSRGRLELLADSVFTIGADGAIDAIHAGASADGAALVARHRAAGTLRELEIGQYLLPGLIDLHVHAPQWPQRGLALDHPLEVWLQQYTFPLEARYADLAFATAVYEELVDGLLANGTTTALYYASIHLPATQRLADICLRRSQRALIGRVAMDHPDQCPSYYRDASAMAAEADTRAFIEYVEALPGNAGGFIKPVITPRFIPSCTDELLHRLGALARATGCHVQTHCSESDWAHGFVQSRCGVSDTAALDGFGLLSRRTILAHGNFIGDDDIGRLLASGSGIAHCPLSNFYLSDAVLPLHHMLECDVHVGLGTDIAGGSSPSILDNARHAILASRVLESGVDPRQERNARRREASRIDAPTAFWLATAAGGGALDMPIGVFKPGFQFDALLIDPAVPGSNLRLAAGDPPHDVLQKIIYGASRVNVREVWVAGRSVHALPALTPD
jgi:guanine deaminase